MLKLKLSRSSPDLIGPHCQSSEDNEPSEIEALRIELGETQLQLEKLQNAAAEELQAVREEEHYRMVYALSSLRHRLHQSKIAELQEQKKILTGPSINDIQPEPLIPSDVLEKNISIPYIDDDDDDDDDDQSSEANLKNNDDRLEDFDAYSTDCSKMQSLDKDINLTNNKNVNDTDDSSLLHDQVKRAEVIADGQEFSREIEKCLQKLQSTNQPQGSSLKLHRPLQVNMRSHQDRFRSCFPHDLHSSFTIMTPICEDKDEYDWFEERKQLLEDNKKLLEKVEILERDKNKLEIELQETKDHNELLEFRILELEEYTIGSVNQHSSKLMDKSTNTEPVCDIDFHRNLPLLLKLAKLENLTETKEERTQYDGEKLSTWNRSHLNSLQDIAVLLQAAFFLQLQKPIYQEILLNKDECAGSEQKIKEKFHELLERSNKNRNEKPFKMDDEAFLLQPENKAFLCKMPSVDKSSSFSMHSSLDSASEISDVSQGGETGYSSDESIDTEDLEQLNKTTYDFPDHFTSFDGTTPLESKMVSDVLQKLAQVCSENDISTSKLFWNSSNVINQIHEVEPKETKDVIEELNKKIKELQRDKEVLEEKWLALKEAYDAIVLNDQTLKRELISSGEREDSLRKNLNEMTEKDNLSKKRIGSLEIERDKLRSEATQLLNLLGDFKHNMQTSYDVLHLGQIPLDCNASNLPFSNSCGNTENDILKSFPSPSKVNHVENSVPLCNNRVESSKDNKIISQDSSFCLSSEDGSLLTFTNAFSHNEIQKLLEAKNHELKSKETEYTMKIEALKCDLEETVTNFEEKLETAQGNLFKLQERLESLSQAKDTLEINFKNTYADLQTEKASYLEQIQNLQTNNENLQKKLDDLEQQAKLFPLVQEEIYESTSRIKEYRSVIHKNKLRELENHLTILCREAEECSKVSNSEAMFPKEFFTGTEDDNLHEKIQEMIKSEKCLKQRIFELENKETAYKETLREADNIITNVEKSYQERVDDLEATEAKLRAKIVQLEQNEKRLRQTLKNTNRNSEVGKLGELLDRLLESEASEQHLRDRIFGLEQKDREQKQKIKHLEKEKEVIENELQEQETIIQNVQSLKRTERELRKQIEALETSECALQETLSQADAILAERENKLQQQIQALEAEIVSLQHTNTELKDSETELQIKLKESYEELSKLHENLMKNNSVASCHLDDHLSISNKRTGQQCDKIDNLNLEQMKSPPEIENDPVRLKQMSDLLENNGKLQLQVMELQAIIERLYQKIYRLESQIVQSGTKPSKEISEKSEHDRYLEMSLELLSKDSKIESLQDKIKILEIGNIFGEIQGCNCCNCINCRPLLHDIESQVHLLDEIISGSCSIDSNVPKQSLSAESRRQEVKTNVLNHKNELMCKSENLIENEIKSNEETATYEYQHQISSLELQKENMQKEMAKLQEKINSQEILLNKKTMELENIRNTLNTVQKENEDLHEKQKKMELSDQQLRDSLSRKKQELKLTLKQVQQLEQQVLSLTQQLRRNEQSTQENHNQKERIQELETALQKMRESERKLHADNLHLHHKVEAQRERINSLQLSKKEYKHIVSKYDMLEKQKKIADQTILPLKNKVLHLTEKCKEKDQLILLLTKQQNQYRKSALTKTYVKQEENNNNNNNNSSENAGFEEILDLSLNEKKFSYSSTSSDPSDSSMDSSSDHNSFKFSSPSPRSRIPRYTALSSPIGSPRLKQDFSNKTVGSNEVLNNQKSKSNSSKTSQISKNKSATHKRNPSTKHSESGAPNPPTNFRITRQIGNDSILVAWTPPHVDGGINETSGYQIFVNGNLHQKVRSPSRTKALLNGLEMNEPFEIAICTVATSGLLSTSVCTTFSPQVDNRPANIKNASNSNQVENTVFNQFLTKQKYEVLHNHTPQNSSGQSCELNLKAGDTVTLFGPTQTNGFFIGEANGQRGLIPAHVLRGKPSFQTSTKTKSIKKSFLE